MKKRILSKRDDILRKWGSFKKHMWLLMQPFLFALVVSLIWWRFVHAAGMHFSKEDEGPLLSGALVMLSVAYGITAAAIFEKVYEKYLKVMESVLTRDERTFMRYRDDRIPIILHLLLFAFAFPLLAIVAGVEYKDVEAGLTAVFSVSFALALYSIAVAELQNPSKSLWFLERVPTAWLEKDVDEFFNLDKEGGDQKKRSC